MRICLLAQLKQTQEFIETHGHHNEMLKEARSLDSVGGIICRIAACASACKEAQGRSPTCHLRQQLDRFGSEPAKPTALAMEAQLPVHPQPAADEDFMAVDDGVLCQFPAPEHVETMMCDREVEPQSRPAPVHHVHHGVASAASSPSIHHGQPAVPSGPQVHHS